MAPWAPVPTRHLPTAASTRSSLAMRRVAFDHMVWGATQWAEDIADMQNTIEYKLKLISGEIDSRSTMSIHTFARAVELCLKNELGLVGNHRKRRKIQKNRGEQHARETRKLCSGATEQKKSAK